MAVEIFRGPDHMATRVGLLLDMKKFLTAKFRENQMNSSYRTTYAVLFELQKMPGGMRPAAFLFESRIARTRL